MSEIKRIYLNRTVYEESLNRVRWIFDEFPNVICAMSGGKDSTATLHLALKIAEEKGRLPLKVMFLDQEAEYENVIVYMRELMNDERVEPLWMQIPFKIDNASSHNQAWHNVWGEGEEWMREKEPNSIKENIFNEDDFYKLFNSIVDHYSNDMPTALLGGMRTEESPARNVALQTAVTYKGITWGKKLNEKKKQFTFYPIYDWSYTDVWKCIHDNALPYCKIYDLQYQYGINVRDMRVSSLIHSTAIHHLFFLQQVEPQTWRKLVARLDGINSTKHLGKAQYLRIKKLPYMFKDWVEYRDYLVEKLVSDEHKESFVKMFKSYDDKFEGMPSIESMHRVQVSCIILNDFTFVKLKNYSVNSTVAAYVEWKGGKRKRIMVGNKNIPQENLIKEILEYESTL